MKFEGQVASDHYLESARVLMLSGGNPYQENASGWNHLFERDLTISRASQSPRLDNLQ